MPVAVGIGVGSAFGYKPGSLAPATFDYLITNDADWATVLALGGATLSGKRVGVQPGTYTAKTVTMTGNAQPVVFEATDFANKPVIPQVVLGTAGAVCDKVTFKGIRALNAAWSTSPAPCVAYTNCHDIVWDRSVFKGGYRGNPAVDFDATKNDYPELAAIYPQFNDSGVITSLVINSAYVGDLKADGTYSLVFSDVSPTVVFTTTPVATFTVSGGNIISTSLTNAGASNATSATNISLGIISKIISWSGQHRMIDYMTFGHQAVGVVDIGAITVTDCEFYDLANGFKVASRDGSAITLLGNFFDRIYMDFMAVGIGSRNPPYPVFPLTMGWNTGTRAFWKSGDPGDPHGDWIQTYMNDLGVANTWTDADWQVTLEGNVFFDGNSRGGAQGSLVSEVPFNGVAYKFRCVGNAVLSKLSTVGLAVDAVRDAFIARNLYARWDPTDTVSNTSPVTIRMGNTPSQGQSVLLDNIYEAITIDSVPNVASVSQVGNVEIGKNGATIGYGSIFAGTPASATLAAVIAAYTSQPAYAGKGPFNADGYINHLTRTIDLTLEKPVVTFPSLTNQVISTAVSSAWVRVLGLMPTVAISGVTNGTYQIADDASGTNATSASAASQTLDLRGKYIRLNQTTPVTGSTSKTTTIALAGISYTFETTTASAASFLSIDNQATAYSRILTPANETGLCKFLIAARFRPDALAANANFFADGSASPLRLYTPTTSVWRFQLGSSTVVHHRTTTTAPAVGAWQTHILAIDLTQTVAANVSKWFINGVNQPQAANSVMDIAGTRTYALTTLIPANFGLLGEGDGGGVLADGAIEFFYMDWGTSGYALPDITDSAVRNKFTADLIGMSNGNGPTGAQPKLFYPGDANLSAWNDGTNGVPNRGSVASRPMIKQAGTYA